MCPVSMSPQGTQAALPHAKLDLCLDFDSGEKDVILGLRSHSHKMVWSMDELSVTLGLGSQHSCCVPETFVSVG